MDRRKLGLALVALGLVGVLALSVVGAAGPVPGRFATYGPGWMRGMHAWMHGWGGWSGASGIAAPSPSPGAREVRVTVDEFAFSPSRLELGAGETVNVVLVNAGALPHDLTIPAVGFSLAVAPGATAEAALTAPAPGTYPFFCSVPGHREAGMVGTLVVT